MAMGGGAVLELTPQALGQAEEVPKNDSTPPVNVGVVGCGIWGRKPLKTLATIPNAPVVAVSDTYPAYLRRGLRGAPKAKGYPSHTELLSDENVQAVVVATPTHQHREVVLAALEAGKHVYCEAPMAHDIDDARAIAKAAEAAPKLNFQVGLQTRSDSQRHFLIDFVRTGAMGKNALARGQWHKKTSWRRVSPNAARQRELNWRLDRKLSLGLIGEIGVHQVDALGWFMNEVMHGAMNAQKHKFARYNLKEIKVADKKRKAGDPIVFNTKGTLNINGKSAPVSMQISIAKREGDKLKVSGKTKLRMSQFGITPPAPKITLGLITTGDEVSVEFEWFVAPKK